MKLIRFLKLSALTLLVSSAATFAQTGEKDMYMRMVNPDKQLHVKGDPLDFGKAGYSKIQSIEFTTFDQLANALSYGGDCQEPIWWEPQTNSLVTVKRGSKAPDAADFNRENSKNNFFIRISKDLGKTWEPSVLIYDSEQDAEGEGRFPSCFAFKHNNDLATIFTGSLVFEKQSTWNGFLMGVYGKLDGNGVVYSKSVKDKDGKEFIWGRLGNDGTKDVWSTSESKIVGGLTDNNTALYIFNVGVVTPAGGSLTDNNNLGARKSIDVENPKEFIPTQWASNKFVDVDSKYSRANMPVALRFGPDGKIYHAVFGNFISEKNTKRSEFGVSVSSDEGDTWSEFDVMSSDVIRDYAATQGIEPDSCYIGYTTKDFAVLDNGDYCFAAMFREANSAKKYRDLLSQVVEVTKSASTGAWTIRKVSTVQGLWLSFIDESNNLVGNSQDIELQISRTVDGKNLMIKWVDLLDVNWTTDSTYQFATSDIFVSTRKAESDTWSAASNVSVSAEYDRNTWVPYLLPDDMKNIPVIKVQSEDASSAASQRRYLSPQVVQCGNFNVTVGVKEEAASESGSTITGIYPNPSVDNTTVNFNIPQGGFTTINIYDMFGNKVSTIFNGMATQGVNSSKFSTKALAPGTYFITMTDGKQSSTKSFTVVH